MAETGIVRFQGNLDPRAQEFIPMNHQHTVILFRPPIPIPIPLPIHPPIPPQIFFPCVSPAPITEFHVAPMPARISGDSTVATRALALSGVSREASETWVRRELERFGDVRAVQMERLRSEAIVTVHFYDLRSAESARSFFNGRGVFAQFVGPVLNSVPEGHNQGTIVIFNLDERVSVSTLQEIFKPFGAIKELRETPLKKHQKFVEFFDVRDAAKALKEMNGKEIHGKPIVIEFSRPGGQCRRFMVNSALTHRNNFNSSSSSESESKFFPPPANLPPRKLFPGRIFPEQNQFPARNNNKPSFFVKTWNKNTSETTTTTIPSGDDRSKTTTNVKTESTKKKVASPPPETNGVKETVILRSTRTRKSKPGKKLDSRFLISEEAMAESSSFKDTRTTVMIKNIPNKYSQKLLLNMLDNHCIHCNKEISDEPYSSYDFVYLPIDFNNKCNVGYGFVNMTSPEATWRLYKAFHLQVWEAFNSRKICEVTYARVQGLEALKEHFKNSKFPCEIDHYLPVLFTPPRDGRQLTEPFPIVGQLSTATHSNPTASTPSSSIDGGDDGAPNNNGDGFPYSQPNRAVITSDGNVDVEQD